MKTEKLALYFVINITVLFSLTGCEYLESNNTKVNQTSNLVEIDKLKNKSMNFGPLEQKIRKELSSDLLSLNKVESKLMIENNYKKSQVNTKLLKKIKNYKRKIYSSLQDINHSNYQGNIREIIIKRKERLEKIIDAELDRYQTASFINENIYKNDKKIISIRGDLSKNITEISRKGSDGYLEARYVVKKIKFRFEKEMDKEIAMINNRGLLGKEGNNDQEIINNYLELEQLVKISKIIGVSSWYLLRKDILDIQNKLNNNFSQAYKAKLGI